MLRRSPSAADGWRKSPNGKATASLRGCMWICGEIGAACSPAIKVSVRAEVFLAGLNACVETILLGRQWTGGEFGERARRILGFVEVQLHLAVLGPRRVEEPSRGIGFVAGCQVAEDEKKLLVFGNGIQAQLAAIQSEFDIAGTLFGLGLA